MTGGLFNKTEKVNKALSEVLTESHILLNRWGMAKYWPVLYEKEKWMTILELQKRISEWVLKISNGKEITYHEHLKVT